MTNDNDSQNIKKQKLPPIWKRLKLIEVSIIKGRIGWKGLTRSEFSNDGILIVNGPDIKDGKVLWDKCLRIPKWRYEESADISVRKGDILVTKDGTIGKTAFIDDLPESASIASGIFLIRTKNEEILNGKFLYQYFNSENFKDLVESVIEGSVIPHLYQRDLEQLTIPLPPLNEQKAIAKILSDLDAKIELNQKMNKILEAISQAIFKHWFIDFEFPNEEGKPYKSSGGEMVDSELGEIPKGWEVKRIKDLCVSIENGGTPRRMEKKYWNGEINWFKTGELLDRPLIDSSEKITKEGLINSSCKLWKINTILIALYASPTVGRLGLLKVDGASNQACSGLVAKEKIGYPYLFYTLYFKRNEFNNIASGAAQQNINQEIIKESKCIEPPLKLMNNFNRVVSKLIDKQTLLAKEEKTLSNVRDSILPKLIMGKIRVPLEE